ncbi:hypothetical protein G6F50_015617 [Rhizopus delemar]|uniref:Gfo/Idh/MocA-like oxidoreductase N-terminal domain-containing protein n=1 Tax=Rhizopus delemar TaxID=936053 RepID=A0A9P7C3Y3_9FUNG|nr:hypothetical protein G6F50_015617 [Rhizopus delemar]
MAAAPAVAPATEPAPAAAAPATAPTPSDTDARRNPNPDAATLDRYQAELARALAGTPGSRVAAVMRRNAALAEDYARRHAIPRWYADADALVADPEVNAIYVATPPSTHMQYALQAIAAGKPVYIEKPMAMDHGECVRILEASARSGVPVSSNCWTAARSVRRAA